MMAPIASVFGGTAPAVAFGPELVVNGSFEQPNIPTGTFVISNSVPGWTLSPGSQGTGIEIQDHRAGNPAAGAGDQFAELDSNGPSGIHQDIATVSGLTYTMSFLYSARPNTFAADNHFRVSAGSTAVVIGPLASTSATNWQPYSLNFVATGSMTRIEFFDLGPRQPSGGGLGAYIDLVSVREVDALYDVCVLYDQTKAHKAGSTVPIKLQLCDAGGNNVSSSGIVVHAVDLHHTDTGASAAVDDSGSANPSGDFRYSSDQASGRYIFNLRTAGLAAGTWALSFSVDGVQHSTYVVYFVVK